MEHTHYIETCRPLFVVAVACHPRDVGVDGDSVHEAEDAVPPPNGHVAAGSPVAPGVAFDAVPAFFSKPVTSVSIINFIVSL